MMRALITAGTGMAAQQTNLDVIAQNLANVNSNAFKSQRAEFQDLMYQSLRASGSETNGAVRTPQAIQIGLGTRFSGNAVNMSQGGLQATGNPFDIAITGEGFFEVDMPDGSVGYTRDGAFKRDSDGNMVTSDGFRLRPGIQVPTEATSFSVSANGNVAVLLPGEQQPTVLGRIQVTTFPNPAGLTRAGQNLYRAGGASGAGQSVVPGEGGSGALQGGFVEGSNVSIVEEMVRMITAQRAYEVNSKAIQTADDMLSTLNQLKR
jgi:flagellar basal-body rod protein FlgG